MLKKLFRKKRPKPTAAAIIEKRGKIFLTKRSHLISDGEKWCLPGGHIDFGETAEECLKREIKEEIGLKTKNVKFLFYHDEIIEDKNLHSVVIIFKIKTSGKIKTNFEVIDTGWFTKKNIEKMDLAFTHKQIIRRFFKGKRP